MSDRYLRETVVAQLRNPAQAFMDRVRLVNYGGCYYFQPCTLRELARLDTDVACTHYNAAFANPAEFTLVLTGNLEAGSLSPNCPLLSL